MKYRFKELLPLAAWLVAACSLTDPPDPLSELEFEADAELVGDTVHYTLFVRNESAREIELTAGCSHEADRNSDAVALKVYDPAARGGGLRYDGSRVPPGTTCTFIRFTVTIPAGDEVSLPRATAVGLILGDSLPDGPYRIAVMPNFSQDLSDREVSVGELTLSR